MEVLQKSPSTFLAVAECDLLAPEAIRYGDFLQKSGADVDVQLYSGATHSILILAGYVKHTRLEPHHYQFRTLTHTV